MLRPGDREAVRRADRLLAIIQLLRRGKVVHARDLAERPDVPERMVYRDIRDLVGSGVPVAGEAGVGHLPKSGFDLPALMFTPEEIEALVLGARIVRSRADPQLAAAAGGVLDKIESVLPERLRSHMNDTRLYASAYRASEPLATDMAARRRAVRCRLKLAMAYRSGTGELNLRPPRESAGEPAWFR